MSITSSRPYLLRALYEWIIDNSCTPYVLVDAEREDVMVPVEYVKDGQIILNISPSAVTGLLIDQAAVEFGARFGGRPMQVYAPISAVKAIYARENGQGMVFGPEPGGEDPEPPPTPDTQIKELKKDENKRPVLKVVK